MSTSLLGAIRAGEVTIVDTTRTQVRDWLDGRAGFEEVLNPAFDEAQGEADQVGQAVYLVFKIAGGPVVASTAPEKEEFPVWVQEVAAYTSNAYMADAYGTTEWSKVVAYLGTRAYSDEQIEEILRSKIPRWAADPEATCDAFRAYFEDPRNHCDEPGYFKEALKFETF